MSARQKGLEKKLQNELARQAKVEAAKEALEAEKWKVGAKDNSKNAALEAKEVEKRRLAAEKARLEAEENATLSNISRTGKPQKKSKNDDLSLLQAALAAAPKTKAQKEAEARKAAEEERRKQEEARREAKEQERKRQEALRLEAERKGVILNHTDELLVPINNRVTEEGFEDISGVDSALDALSLTTSLKVDEHPEKRMKALYKAYYEAQLPILKQNHPGLKLSQYEERIFDLWKKAPENPKNQVTASVKRVA